MSDHDFLRPATYLTPGELATIDQWEMDVKVHVEECVQMMRDIEEESGPQSLAVWAQMFLQAIDPERMASTLAYLILKEARRAPSEPE